MLFKAKYSSQVVDSFKSGPWENVFLEVPFSLFKKVLYDQNIDLNEREMDVLFLRCPVIAADHLFHSDFKDKTQLLASIDEFSPAYHKSAHQITELYKYISPPLDIKSERVQPKEVIILNNRIRHTVGTNAAREGKSAVYIAGLLGNSPKAVTQTYIDLSNEQRANIDDKFIATEFLIQSFNTSIRELKSEKEFVVSDEFNNELGQIKSHKKCSQCNDSRGGKPIACYGCENFSALITADHQGILEKAETLYKSRKHIGELPEALTRLKMQIRFIRITANICKQLLNKKIGLC